MRRAPRAPRVASHRLTQPLLALASRPAPGSVLEKSGGRGEEAVPMYQQGRGQSPGAPGVGRQGGWDEARRGGIVLPSPLQTPCPEHPAQSSSLQGPPGRAEERIADGLELPELRVGDWLVFEDMGAYTVPASSPLGGCPQPQITYAMSRVAW